MLIFPAIDLYRGKAVRLLRGDYGQMTVYSDDPPQVAASFAADGARWVHLVDLEGAREGGTPNLSIIERILSAAPLSAQAGGGIRSMRDIERYCAAGVSRVILGTSAVTDPALLRRAVREYGGKIAVGVDLKGGFAAIRGWTERTDIPAADLFGRLEEAGVQTVICTDISRDGAMQGANRALYSGLLERISLRVIASGGVSSLEDVRALRQAGLYGAIIGKAFYTGAISLKEAIQGAL